ncbi:hypothetical protein ACLBWP_10700 [Microbacterium sp. M1A1_1b]
MTDAFTDAPPFAVFLNGSYGVGKTLVLDHIGNLLAAAGRPFSLMDVDWFHRSWPVAGHDPDNTAIEAQNIAAVWANYRTAGPRQLVMSGVLVEPADVRRSADAVQMPIRSVRLVASPQTLEARPGRRYDGARQQELRWHLERAADLQERQAVADLDELVLPTDEHSPAQVAQRVVEHFGLVTA